MATASAPDYTEFDRKLLGCIEAGTSTTGGLITAARLTFALKEAAKPFAGTPGEEFRVVDRRLQALRKKGTISWIRRGREVVWQLTQ